MSDRNCEFELSVGDVLYIGEHMVTVIDIDGPDVSFRIDIENAADGEIDLAVRTCVPGK